MIHTPSNSDRMPISVNGKRTALDHRSKVNGAPDLPIGCDALLVLRSVPRMSP